jgi:hypothetical protein
MVIKSKRMRWEYHVACMGGMKRAYKILVRKGRDHLRDLGTVGKIILKWILNKWGVKWTETAQDRVLLTM